MKRYWTRLIIMLLALLFLAALFNVIGNNIENENISKRNVIAQRITSEIEQKALETSTMIINYESILEEVLEGKRSEWEKIYGKEFCPVNAKIMVLSDYSSKETKLTTKSNSIVSGVYLGDALVAVVEYEYHSQKNRRLIFMMNIGFGLAMIMLLIHGIWIYRKILVPFNKLSDYPERLSKGELTEKLPESKNRYFGKYIWGMNMLSDKLENDRRTIQNFNVEKQKFLTTMVHGIKTPAASIKLLATAISTGLYSPDGQINEKDAELAEKISKNVDEIEKLVSEALEEGTTAVFDYDPDVKAFYRDKLCEYINEEYSNSLKMSRIPFEIKSEGNPLINSDFDGVCRILRQLMDNAIKYGDGTGITLSFEKNDEGHFITVSDNGKPLPETELSFVFNSMWRGSNAGNVKGNGIGLYESRFIARKLGGDIRMRTGDNLTEVTLFIPV